MNKKTFLIFLFCITAFGFLLRFWNYGGRYGLAYDQAHDALVAREAIRQGKIPLVGPFSSAGPFQTVGTWYWLLMIPTALYPHSLLSPWIFLTLLSVLFIIGMGFFGKYLEDDWFGLLLAALTALSTAQIAQSINLTNQTPIPFFSFLTIVCAVLYLRSKKIFVAFFLGFFASFAASIHLQGMSLGIIVFFALLFSGRALFKSLVASCVGAVIPMTPLFLWDAANDFINMKNMFYYYRYDQFNISLDVLGRRWLTYLNDFWPREWAHIIGGFPYIGMGIAIIVLLFFGYYVLRRKLSPYLILLFVSFFCMVILVRYTRVPIFASFITFLHPFVILITGWGIYTLIKHYRYIGYLFFLVVIIGTMWKTSKEVFTPRVNWTARAATEFRNMLRTMYPNEKFAVYDYKYDETRRSVPYVLFLDEANLISDTGRRIGFIRLKAQEILQTDIISTDGGLISDLTSSSSATLLTDGWAFINPSKIYSSTEEWRE